MKRLTLLAGVRMIALAILVQVYTAPAWSQENGVSNATFQVLQQADAFLRQGQAERARQALSGLQDRIKDNAYEQAVVLQYLAYAHAGSDNPRAALGAALDAIKSGLLDGDALHGLHALAGQAAFDLEDYRASIDHLAQWLQQASAVDADVYYMAGYAAYRANRPDTAIMYLEQAAALHKASSPAIIQLLLSLYIDRKAYAKAEPLVKRLVADAPQKREWWLYLSSLYAHQNRYDQALATMMLAYYAGQARQSDILQLVRLNAQQGLPAKAARLLETEMANQRLVRNYEHLKLLYSCWRLARENGQAAQVLAEAAVLAPNGEDFLMLGRLSMQRNDWRSAKTHFQQGLRKGGLKRVHQARLWLGIAAFKTDDAVLARQVLEPLLEVENVKHEASYWLKRIERPKYTHMYQYSVEISGMW